MGATVVRVVTILLGTFGAQIQRRLNHDRIQSHLIKYGSQSALLPHFPTFFKEKIPKVVIICPIWGILPVVYSIAGGVWVGLGVGGNAKHWRN